MNKPLSKLWSELEKKFRGNPLSFDFKNVVLNHLGEKRSDVFTHYVHSYPAKMFPYIPLYFLSIPELCPPDGVVLDPFCGSGTVLLESIVHPAYKRDAYGVELNPAARLISKVKTTPLNEEELAGRIEHLFKLADEYDSIDISLPKSKKIKFWFSEKVAYDLAKLRVIIEQEGKDDDCKDFFWVCFSSVIRKVCKADPFIPPPVLLKPKKYEQSLSKYKSIARFLRRAEKKGVKGLFKDSIKKNFCRIASLNKVNEIKEGKKRASVIWDDARKIKTGKLAGKGTVINSGAEDLPSETVDFILTSPPYLTAQKYIRTLRLELLWLGFSEDFILKLQRKIIGTERVSVKEAVLSKAIGVEKVDSLIKWSSSSPNRAAELISYFDGMKQAISEMYRVLKHGAYAVIVLGNNRVLGREVETYQLLSDIASVSGFKLQLVLKDKIRGRGMITKRHNTGGLIKEEFMLVLKKEDGENVHSN